MQKGKDQKHWEKIGKSYSKFWKSKAKQEISKKELNFINKYLQKNKGEYILDIGVGSGRIIENFLSNSKVKEIYGIDWAGSMVDFCRNKFRNDKKVKDILVCNISEENLPFDRKFDFISAIRVLKYNKNWLQIIGKIVSHLNKDGIFVFTIPNKNAILRFTTPETAIYTANKGEIVKLIEAESGEILKITTFTKLPDFFYDLSDNKLYVKAILFFEESLRKILGDIFLGRAFFVAVRKK